MAASSVRPISLSDKEKKEFDHVTLDDIHDWRDVSKLRRLERYMTQEGFPTTASATAMRIKALSAGAEISDDTRREELEAEYKASAHELMSWTHKIVSEEQELSLEPTPLSSAVPGIRKGMKVASDAASSSKITQAAIPKAKGDSSVGVNARSGREYYDKWEAVAEDELQKLSSEDKADSSAITTSTTPSTSAANPENTQRICKAAQGMSPVERRRQAESERHKGNDYFRAHDYRAAIEAYTVAVELDPQSPAARGNRAAAYLKLRMWSDAETDACEVLRLDPGNLKAQLRRAQARCELGQMNSAREDALAVLAKVPDEPAMFALVERADSALKQSSKRMVIEEVASDVSAVQSSQPRDPMPLAKQESGPSSSCPEESSHTKDCAVPDVPSTSHSGPSGRAQNFGATSGPVLSQSGVATVAPDSVLPERACTVKAHDEASGSSTQAFQASVEDRTCVHGTAPSGDPVKAPMRSVPITVCSDSDSDDDAGFATSGADGTAAEPSTGISIAKASSLRAAAAPPAGVSGPADVGAGSGCCAAADASNTGTGIRTNSKPAAMPVSKPVRIQVVEDDEEAAAADDAWLAAASAPDAAVASENASSGTSVSVAEKDAPAHNADDTAASNFDNRSVRAMDRASNAGPASAVSGEGLTSKAIKSPETVAEDLMEKGRAAFAAGQLQDAKDTFTAAAAAWPLLAAAYSNRAAVSTRLGEWSHVVEDSTVVLALANAELLKYKALCRRAKARAHLADHMGSLRDLKDAEYFVPDNERKALQRDINATSNIISRVKQEQAQMARKRAAKKAKKEPLRSTAYGKVTVEELDSDDEEEEPDDDPLAEAGRAVRETINQASRATGDVHARAQEATEQYKKDVADAAAAVKAAQRVRASTPTPAKTKAPQHDQVQPKNIDSDVSRAAPSTPAPTGTSGKASAAPSTVCSDSDKPKRAVVAAASEASTQAQPRAVPVEDAAATVGKAPEPAAATREPPRAPAAAAPDVAPSGQPSSSGSDSSYVLVDAPSTGTSKAPVATAQEAGPKREDAQAVAAPFSGASKPEDGDQGKADILRAKGIDAWKAGDMARALGLWSQAAQVAPKDYRVHLNISQALLRMSRHADALAAANTALEALEAAPNAPTDLFAKAQYRRGVALQELQKLPEALAALEASHEAMPTPETFAAVAKLREQIPQNVPSTAAAVDPKPSADIAHSTAAESDRAPWGAVPLSGGPAAHTAQEREVRPSGESDSSYVHVPSAGSTAGGAAADGSSGAPAGALRATRESVSGHDSAHADADADGVAGPTPAVVPASELESAGGPPGDAALRRFKVPIQEPPASAEGSPSAGRNVVAVDDASQTPLQTPARAPQDGAAVGDEATEPTIRSSAAGVSAGGAAGEEAGSTAGRTRPESPQDLAEQALRVQRARDVLGGADGGSGAGAVLPLPPLPTTAHEFLQAIQGLRRVAETPEQAEVAVVAYVCSLPTDDYAKVFKSNLDGKIVAELVAALKATVGRDKAWCKSCLLGLIEVERVVIVLVMLPAAQKKALADIKAQLMLTPEESKSLACIR